MKNLLNFIDGKFVASRSGKTLEVYEPATGKIWAEAPRSSAEDVEAAIAAATGAFPAWSSRPATERARILRKISDGITARKEELATIESTDSGKPLTASREVDIPRSALNFEFFADAATQFSSDAHLSDPHTVNYTTLSPLGVVACISPWNLPLYLLTWKIAPALAAGNCVVAKPSEVTPATATLLGEICQEAGLPAGVLNIVHGTGAEAGAALCTHPHIAAISFTGSTQTGMEISRVAAPQFKKLSLEMGGKNPTLVFADCDFEQAITETLRGAFSNQGQICLCGSRILVERPLYEKFKTALVSRIQRLRQGDPMESSTEQGAVVSRIHYDKIISHLKVAEDEGGKFLTGGVPKKLPGRCENGWFIRPTLIEGLSATSRTNQEEIFGPVATIQPFAREEDAVAEANCTRYGLSASIWTQNLDRAHRVAHGIRSGIVWVNCWMVRDLRTPFGGVKDSGVGREGGWHALRFFTEPKNICIRITGQSEGRTP